MGQVLTIVVLVLMVLGAVLRCFAPDRKLSRDVLFVSYCYLVFLFCVFVLPGWYLSALLSGVLQ